jgi:hypothetical protein
MLLLIEKAKQTRQVAMKLLNDPRSKQEILGRLHSVRPDSPPRWGKMTARQMVCHLSDTFLAAMGEKPTQIAQGYAARKLIKWVALYVPLPWPKGVPTPAECDQAFGGTPPADFSEDLQRLQVLVEGYTEEPRKFQFRPHPIFLEMSERDWMRWGYLHMDHHLRQFGV